MAFRRTAVQEVPVESPQVDYDVLELRNLREHPRVRILWERKAALAARLPALEDERRNIQRDIDVIEKNQGADIAEQGDQWQPPQAWRQAKEALAELDAQQRMIKLGLTALEDQITEAMDGARIEVEQRLKTLRRPQVDALVQILEQLSPVNAALRTTEAVSQRLLGYGSWHLCSGALHEHIKLVKSTQGNLARALGEAENGAA